MAPDQLSYDELVARLEDAEELVGALISEQTDAVVSSAGVHVLRLHETDRALQAAKQGLEQMLTQRTQELRTANENLRQSEERLRRLYESGVVGVVTWTAEGAITDANDKFLEMVGYSREEMESGGLRWADITPPEYRLADAESLAALRETGIGPAYEKAFVRKDGSRISVLVASATLGDAREKGIGIALDISERKRAEQALIRSEKLASVGRMAATVAHEINNPLELVINSVYIASLDQNLSEQARQSLAAAEQELGRIAQLTRQTLGFYRENGAPQDVNVSVLVNEVLEMYAPKILQHALKIESEHDSSLQIKAIPGEIRQVISNILANAIDASAPGGRIRIRSRCVGLKNSRWGRLTLADTGEGIPRENLKHIFEPFFTTKESVGTGLGLWVTSDIVKRHQGILRVKSRRGEGTVFVIMFKTASQEDSCGPGVKSENASPCSGR
jgi:PAS domain S-box-containing protein